MRRPKCPVCGAAVFWQHTNVRRPFPCLSCGELIRVPRTFFVNQVLSAVIVASGIAFLSGLRGAAFLSVAVVLAAPVTLAIGFITPFVFGMPLEAVPSGGFRTLGESEDD